MSIERDLNKAALEIAAQTENRAARIHQEYLDAQTLAANKKKEFEAASSAVKRAADFQVTLGANYQCPLCWIASGRRSDLRPIPSQTRDDIFRCDHGHDFAISR